MVYSLSLSMSKSCGLGIPMITCLRFLVVCVLFLSIFWTWCSAFYFIYAKYQLSSLSLFLQMHCPLAWCLKCFPFLHVCVSQESVPCWICVAFLWLFLLSFSFFWTDRFIPFIKFICSNISVFLFLESLNFSLRLMILFLILWRICC